jgi:putative tryptophan/tyrosine transport system substrate-binding protein
MKAIGFLNSGSPSPFTKYFEVFRQGLEDTGYIEGENVEIIPRWAEGDYGALQSQAAELVARGVKVIAATGGLVSALEAVKATAKIPIVFLGGVDPAQVEFVKGTKGPPPNATGVDTSTTASVPERLAKLRELAPNATKVAVLLRPGTLVYESEKDQAVKASLEIVEASDESQYEPAFALAVKKGANAIIICADPSFTNMRQKLVALAKHFKLPAAYSFRPYPEAGGLMSYGPILRKAYRQVGEYTGKILNGMHPGELPVVVMQIADFEEVINSSTAKGLGLELTHKRRKGAQIIGED